MKQNTQPLRIINGEELMNADYTPTKFCVDTLLPQGLSILAGAPKIGKSWLALDLALHVSKGEPMWGLASTQGGVLYLCLEDSFRRIQERLCNITADVPDNLFFAVQAGTIADGLCDQIAAVKEAHADLTLVIVDTFQLIRNGSNDISYAGDYDEVRTVKELADRLGISILLIHHLRKMGDSDPLNKISGTTGLSGAADAVFILDRTERGQADAHLDCTGRDIPSRRFDLKFGSTVHTWDVLSDSLETPTILFPTEIIDLISFMHEEKTFSGSNTEFTERFNAYAGTELQANQLKLLINRFRYQLEEEGIRFRDTKSNGKRVFRIGYFPSSEDSGSGTNDGSSGDGGDRGDGGDGENAVQENIVPVGPAVPAVYRV